MTPLPQCLNHSPRLWWQHLTRLTTVNLSTAIAKTSNCSLESVFLCLETVQQVIGLLRSCVMHREASDSTDLRANLAVQNIDRTGDVECGSQNTTALTLETYESTTCLAWTDPEARTNPAISIQKEKHTVSILGELSSWYTLYWNLPQYPRIVTNLNQSLWRSLNQQRKSWG